MAGLEALRARIDRVVREFMAENPETVAAAGGACLITALEDQAIEIGDGVTAAVLTQSLAAAGAESADCPTCGCRGLRKAERVRSLQTRRGRVEMAENELYCKRCRRSFFPSVSSARTGSGV